MPVALGFILFGILLLLRNLDIIRGGLWKFAWPLIIIVIGMSMIFKGVKKG